MTKYVVTLEERVWYTISVEADCEEEAAQLAEERFVEEGLERCVEAVSIEDRRPVIVLAMGDRRPSAALN